MTSGLDERLREVERRMLRELPASLHSLCLLTSEWGEADDKLPQDLREEVARLAHHIRGRAGMLQLVTLTEAAGALEQLCSGMPDATAVRDAALRCSAAFPNALNH